MEGYERRKRSKKARTERLTREVAAEALPEMDQDIHSCSSESYTQTDSVRVTDSSTMTDVSVCYVDALEEECVLIISSKQLESNEWSENSLKTDHKKVNFYTGLPSFSILTAVFTLVSSHIGESSKTHSLSVFEQFIATLMKLRLSLFDQDLAYRFGVHQSTISRNFRRWIDVMYICLKPLIRWPGREELQKTMPLDFKAHFKKCVVIDCFEVFCERPKSLKARAQTYSKYKHHNTVKFLIGIAPQGVITFISKGWGGRVSDKYLTECSGILDNLLPGDLVLADRGFNVQDTCGLYCAEVKFPPFMKGKKQLSKVYVDIARQLSRVRIHVERVIGFLRQKYTILQSTLPINLIMSDDNCELSLIDKIVTVCSALCNCCDSVVPFE